MEADVRELKDDLPPPPPPPPWVCVVQCFNFTNGCDGQAHCVNAADEQLCKQKITGNHDFRPTPAVIHFKNNTIIYSPLPKVASAHGSSCPSTHFQCPHNDYCLPVFLRCNDVYDCPGHEDEYDCEEYQCEGFYRCRSSTICVHMESVCDDVFHCPSRDDELLCTLPPCPTSCTCHGLAFVCSQAFPVDQHRQLRYLHANGSGLGVVDMANNTMLVHLGLPNCGIDTLFSGSLDNLHSLDLSHNQLRSLRHASLSLFPRLRRLSLVGNPLASSVFTKGGNLTTTFLNVLHLDLSHIRILHFDLSVLYAFPNLQSLNLSSCGIERITRESSNSLKKLRSFDLRGSTLMYFPRQGLQAMRSLKLVFASNFKVCCPGNLPLGFDLNSCYAPFNELSSCDSLLGTDFYRVALSVYAVLALIGNAVSFVFRSLGDSRTRQSSFAVFVIHLCIADFLMGIYLAVVGVADRLLEGVYLWEDTVWRHSVACTLAGFVCLLSCETSAIIICLITVDRFLVLRFPFSRWHISPVCAHVLGAVTWASGVLLGCVPLLSVTRHWCFYSQSGTCLPLPVTTKDFAGHSYSFGVLIAFNFLLFLVVALGQAFIYMSVRANSMTTGRDMTKTSRDIHVARRLITIALTDFFCWFPIGLCGLLASQGVVVSAVINVTLAICVLPLNSAVNPFLYTVNLILERRRLEKEEELLQRLKNLTDS